MNKLSKTEMENYRSYSKMNKSIFSCKVNQLNVHLNSDYPHELAKFKIFWKLRKEGNKVITEAWQRGTDFRRDLVDLSNGIIIEVEHSKSKRGKRHPRNIQVYWYDLGRDRTLEETKDL